MEKSIESAEMNLGLIQYIKKQMSLPENDIRTYSPLTLAFIGDGVYDLIIRTIIVEHGNAPVNKLHKKVSNLVKAPAQMELFRKIENILTEEELSAYKRGRNAKSFTSAKNASITEYRIATGFEALIGYLYLTDRFPRIIELVRYGLFEAEVSNETKMEPEEIRLGSEETTTESEEIITKSDKS
jgi:ribonuclease-3 family protein